ncbi:MAG TPA: hypothetical protein VF666_06830 [Pyrinomonadaceae bacterium]
MCNATPSSRHADIATHHVERSYSGERAGILMPSPPTKAARKVL